MNSPDSYRTALADRIESGLGEGLDVGTLPRGAFLKPEDWLHVLEALRCSGPNSEATGLLRELYKYPGAPDRGGCDWKCHPCDCGYAEWEPGYRALQARVEQFLKRIGATVEQGSKEG